MKDLIEILHAGDYSCVIANRGVIRTFSQRGIADLYGLVTHNADLLYNASVADKIIGKAAAALLILGKIKEVYTDTISLSALTLLREAGISVNFGQVVSYIYNRDQSGWCPLERLCYEEKKVENILSLVERFMSRMQLVR